MITSAIEARLTRLERAAPVRRREHVPESFVRLLENVPRELMVPPTEWRYGNDGRLKRLPQPLTEQRVLQIRTACRRVAQLVRQGQLTEISDIMREIPDEVLNGLSRDSGC